jgi:hypothetical protein
MTRILPTPIQPQPEDAKTLDPTVIRRLATDFPGLAAAGKDIRDWLGLVCAWHSYPNVSIDDVFGLGKMSNELEPAWKLGLMTDVSEYELAKLRSNAFETIQQVLQVCLRPKTKRN